MPTEQEITKVTVDFTKVEDRGEGPAHVDGGDYLLQIEGGRIRTSSANNKYIEWRTRIKRSLTASRPGGMIYYRTMLEPEENLWRLYRFLGDLGKNMTKSKVAIDTSKYAGMQFGATLGDGDPYEVTQGPNAGTTRINSEVKAHYPASVFEDAEASAGGKAAAAPPAAGASAGGATPRQNGTAQPQSAPSQAAVVSAQMTSTGGEETPEFVAEELEEVPEL